MSVYVKLSHSVVHLKLTQHCKSTILQKKKKKQKKKTTSLKCLEAGFLFYVD